MNNRRLIAHLLLTVAYVVSGKLGLMLALAPGYASPIFPPAGIAVAAAFIGGKRTLPWVFIGSLLLNVWVDYAAHHQINATGLTAALAIAAASMLQSAFGGWWLRRLIGYPTSFDCGRDILYFLLSALAVCLTSATLSVGALTALGIVSAANFAVNWAAWWVGDTLGVVVMLPLVMVAVGAPRALWQSRVRTVAVPILLIFAFFVVIFLKTNQWEYNYSLTEFRMLSQQTVNRVQTQLEGQEFLLEQTAGLFLHDKSGRVTREEFHRFIKNSLLRFPMVQALEWAPRVVAARRASFEAAQRKDFPSFEIREQNTAGQLQRAGERPQFYPVTYVEPPDGNELSLGFDLASSPDRKAALTETVKRGVVVATPTVRLVQERQEQAGILLLLAVNNGSNGSGVALTVLRMDDFMNKLLPDMRSMLYTRLIDLGEQKALYDNFTSGNQNVFCNHTFSFGTRRYLLQTAPTPAYFMQHHGWQSWSVLAAGLLGTGLFGSLLLLGTGYTARIEAEVKNRTRELKESESRFRSVFDNSNTGMALVNCNGQVTQFNETFLNMLCIDAETLLRSPLADFTHPDDMKVERTYFDEILAGKRNDYRMEKRYVTCPSPRWVDLSVNVIRGESGEVVTFVGVAIDITKRKLAEEEMLKIEWLLRPKVFSENTYTPVYGDITKHNKDRTILNALGAGILANIVNDFMGLLGTSSAVYEKNGDYAAGIFSSGWCQFLDCASFKHCNTDDIKKALNCGKWLCHESCWAKASKTAIESGKPTDIKCAGGLHIYAVPIRSGKEIIGSINFGYGDPPTDPEKLKGIAAKFQVDIKELTQTALEYQTRPQFIIDLAKHRLAGAADLIGIMVENKRVLEALGASERKFRALFEGMVSGFALHEIVFDKGGMPVDYITLEANLEFERLLKVKKENIIGKKVYESIPGLDRKWLDVFSKVALTGESCSYEEYASNLGKWFAGTVFSPQKGLVAGTFVDITDRKQAEDKLKKQMEYLERFNRAMVGRELQMIALKREINELCQAAGEPARYVVSTANQLTGGKAEGNSMARNEGATT